VVFLKKIFQALEQLYHNEGNNRDIWGPLFFVWMIDVISKDIVSKREQQGMLENNNCIEISSMTSARFIPETVILGVLEELKIKSTKHERKTIVDDILHIMFCMCLHQADISQLSPQSAAAYSISTAWLQLEQTQERDFRGNLWAENIWGDSFFFPASESTAVDLYERFKIPSLPSWNFQNRSNPNWVAMSGFSGFHAGQVQPQQSSVARQDTPCDGDPGSSTIPSVNGIPIIHQDVSQNSENGTDAPLVNKKRKPKELKSGKTSAVSRKGKDKETYIEQSQEEPLQRKKRKNNKT
jgi:hypothetical protein